MDDLAKQMAVVCVHSLGRKESAKKPAFLSSPSPSHHLYSYNKSSCLTFFFPVASESNALSPEISVISLSEWQEQWALLISEAQEKK